MLVLRKCLRQPKAFSPFLFAPLFSARYTSRSFSSPHQPPSTPPTTSTSSASFSSSPSSSSSPSPLSSSSPTSSPTPSSALKWRGTPELPYINQDDVLFALDTYVNSAPLRNILVLWGTKSSGKTAALLAKEKEWEAQGHPVIQIDLKEFDGTQSTFASRFCEATVNALKRHRKDLPEELIEKALRNQRERLRDKSSPSISSTLKTSFGKLRTMPLYMQAYFNKILVPNTRMIKKGEKEGDKEERVEPYFAMMKEYVKDRLQEGDFKSVLELLEEIARLQNNTNKTPIFIIREVDHLESLPQGNNSTIFYNFMNYFETYKQGQKRVPVIVESAGSPKLYKQHSLASEDSFKFLQLKNWKKEDAEKSLVKSVLPGQQGPIFTPEEFGQIWDFSEGHAGTIFQVHSYLRDGVPLQEAMDTILQRTEANLQTLVAASGRYKSLAFLRIFQANNYKMLFSQIAEPFLANGLLFLDGKYVYPRNKVLRTAIDRMFVEDREQKEQKEQKEKEKEQKEHEKEKEKEQKDKKNQKDVTRQKSTKDKPT